MKAGWIVKSLEDIASFSNGLWTGKKGPFVTAKVLRNTNFRPNGELSLADIAEIDVEVKQFKKRQLQKGDLILERSGGGPKQPVGRVVCFSIDEEGYSFSNFTSVIRIKDCSRVNFKFLHQVLNWWHASGKTEALQSRSTGIRNLDFNAYKQLDVPLPPLEEQQQIVAILDEAFEGLARARANAEANLENARELFDGALARTLTNGTDNWERRKIGQCFRLKSGDGLTTKDMIAGPYPVYGGNGIAGSHDKYNLSGENVIIGRVGALCGNVRFINENIWLTDNAFKVVDYNVSFDPHFLTCLLNFKNLRTLARQAAQPVISNSSLADLEIDFPLSTETQSELALKILDVEREIQRLIVQYQTTMSDIDHLRQSLLRKAFAGELT